MAWSSSRFLLRSAQSLRGRAPPSSSSSSSSSSSLRFLSASSFSSSSCSFSRGFKPNHIWGSLVQTGAVTGISSMEAHSGGRSEVSATINLGAAEHQQVVVVRREGLLSATLVDLKEKCMQVLGAHLQRHSGVSLEEEPDLDVLEESLEDEDDDDDEGGGSIKKKPVEGAAPPPKKKSKVNKK